MNHMTPQPEGGLLRSPQWADFLRAKGDVVIDIGEGEQEVHGVVNVLKIVGKYLYVPRMIVTDALVYEEIIRTARQKKYGWVRIDAGSKEVLNTIKKIKGVKAVHAPHDMQPCENFIIDITQDKEVLLAAMKGKTRYNIKIAQKKNVAVHFVTRSENDFDQVFSLFYTMIEQTARRKGVRFHAKAHYQKMFDTLPEDMIALCAAEVDGGVFIAANIVTFYGGVGTYLHGATADTHRNLMAPFLLQWSSMQAAKVRGCTHYDFGGVKTEQEGKEIKGDWAGITRFKLGFAPKMAPTVSQGSYDIILDTKKYYLYRTLQKLHNLFS